MVVSGDRSQLQQILNNLLSNAIKFTRQGEIRLQAEYRNKELHFSVQDTGTGMTEEETTRIFTAFERLDNARNVPGFGLGLAIASRLVSGMQGSLTVKSKPGEGSTFTAFLPLLEADESTQAQMETIAGKDEKYYFTGKTDSGISYKWTYNGSQIQNPVEQKLLVQCSEDGTEEVKKLANDAPYALKVTLEKMNLAAPAKLTLNLKEKWDADKVLYCLEEDGKLYQLDTAKITTRETGKKKTERTTLTFNVTKTGGDFYLIGGSNTGESTDESDDKSKGTADNKDTQNGENSTGSSGGQSSTDGNTSSGQTDSSGDGTGNTDTSGGDDSSDTAMTCTFSIECSTILNNWDDLKESKAEFVPADGWILYPSEVEFYEGETVFDVLKRVCNQASIQMESEWTPMYNSYYVSGINNLYEFDCGKDSGWMYCVNGWYPNYGCSKYTLEDGDTVEWRYTCNLGRDVGDQYYD